MSDLSEALKQYGTVERCEVVDGEVHIKVTKGFSINAIKTFECMRVIVNYTYDEYPILKEIKTDYDLLHVILAKAK